MLDLEYEDSVLNLAIDETIMEETSRKEVPNSIRFWRNPKITIIIGRFQIPELEVNQSAVQKYGATVVRRFTGGGAVYNDQGNLNYSISVMREDPSVPKAIGDITPTLCKGVVEGLRILGLKAEFEQQGMYVHINGKKVSGTAGIMRRTVVFVHGTLLVDSDLAKLREILDVPPYPQDPGLRKFVKSTKREVTTIERELGRKIQMSEVKAALRKGFAYALGISMRLEKAFEHELELARTLADARRESAIVSLKSPNRG